MKTLVRCCAEHAGLWRAWLPLLGLTALLPVAVLALPLVEKRLVDDVLLKQRFDLLPATIALYGGLWLLSTAGGIVRTALQTYVRERAGQHLRQRLFAHCGELSLAFARREHSGRTMALFQTDVTSVAGLFSGTAVAGIGSLAGLALGIVLMFSLSWQLAVAAGLTPFLVGAVGVVVTRPLRPLAQRARDKTAELSERVQEQLAGIREVAAFGREETQQLAFAQALRELVHLRMRLTWLDSTLQAGQSLFTLTVTLVILGYGGYLVLQGETTLGTLVAMQTLFSRTYQPAERFLGLIKDAQVALASADRIYAVLDETPQVRDRPGARAPETVEGRVTFDRVGFGYQPGRPVLQNVSFSVSPGELVALVGPSGAGKSTLASLIARFYDPTEGRVLLDGVDLRDLTLAGLRRQIGIVFQDTFLFASTIGENIAFGRHGASEVDVVAAARAAHAWEFVERLPDGLGTRVGERGARLSEGQKQRLAIARALLRDPRVLILDEPTSALDARSEHLLQAALDNLMQGRTTFVIAHRLATVRRADRILVLDEGRLADQGTHDELLQRGGLYRELYALQLGRSDGSESERAQPPANALVTAVH